MTTTRCIIHRNIASSFLSLCLYPFSSPTISRTIQFTYHQSPHPMLNSPLHFIYYIRKYRAQPCHPVASKFFHRRERRKGKKVENSVCKNDSFSTHQFRRTLKKRCSVVSFQKERKRERRRGVLINPPSPQTLAWIYYSPPSSPPPRSILFIFSAEYRETDSNYQRSKKKEKKRRKERKEIKKERKRGVESFWKIFPRLGTRFFFLNRSSIIVES